MHKATLSPGGLGLWMPIRKAYESTDLLDDEGRPARIVEGYASVDDGEPDLQGDIVEIDGIDESFFMKKKLVKGREVAMGAINWCHSNEPEHHLGRPIETRKGPGFYFLKARLDYGGKADHVWEKLIKNKPHEHGYGFSLEGAMKARNPRDPRRVSKSFLTKIAITPQDINGKTWMDVGEGIRKGLDPRDIVLDLDGEASQQEESMSSKAEKALLEGAQKLLSGQEKAKAKGYLQKGLELFGLSKSDADRLATETETALKKGVDDSGDDNDNDDKDGSDEPMAKGDCVHKGQSGKHCSECGAVMRKGVESAYGFTRKDDEVAAILDATPALDRLAKGLSSRMESFISDNESIREPMVKAFAANLLGQDAINTKVDTLAAGMEEMKKGMAEISAALGAAGKQPAESLRKSADGTTETKESQPKPALKAVEKMSDGTIRYMAIDRETRLKLERNLNKAVMDGTIGMDEGSAALVNLQGKGAFYANEHAGLDLLAN